MVRLVIFATLVCSVISIRTGDNPHGPIHRAKRYAPLVYMNKVNPLLEDDGAAANNKYYTKRFMLGREQEVSPVSHFREFRQRQNQNIFRNRPDASLPAQDSLLMSAASGAYPYQRNTRRYHTKSAAAPSKANSVPVGLEDLSNNLNQLGPLTDEEMQTVLLLLNGYALSSKGGNPGINTYSDDDALIPTPEQYYNPSYLTPDDLRRVARMYNRENGQQGRFFDLEQPASLDNEDSDKVEFLTPKRSKRVGIHHMAQEPSGRFKKETDRKVVAQLEKVFNGPKALPLTISNDKGAVTTDKAVVTSVSHDHSGSSSSSASSGQIPAPGPVAQQQALGKNKAKKAIDWSEYFGIDKKNAEIDHDHGATVPAVPESTKSNNDNDNVDDTKDGTTVNSGSTQGLTAQQEPTSAVPIPSVKPKAAIIPGRITEPTKTGKESKEHKKLRVREENETENKSDRKWILNEFYKNLAMSTNVKRKRDVSRDEADELADLEQKMAVAGDEIIWDTLKYTGAHKDQNLSPTELAQVKKEIIEKLAAAYKISELREAIEEFRENLLAMKSNQI